MKAKEKGGSSGGGSLRGAGDHGRGRGGRCNGGVSSNLREDTMAREACHSCAKVGHFTRECRSMKKNGEAHAVQEKEASLMLVTGKAFQTLSPPSPPPAAPL
jgi:hypothetical protein